MVGKNNKTTQQSKSVKNRKRNGNRRFRRFNYRKPRNQLNAVSAVRGIVGQTQSVKLTKREMWFNGSFTSAQVSAGALVTINKRFDCNDGPAWFKNMCGQYEKYKLHGVNLIVRFGGSAMTKGIYVLTYNANLAAINNSKTFEQLCCQKGSNLVTAAKQYGSLHINGSSLTGYSTSLPTEGTNESYCFNAILAGVPAEVVDYTVEVEYIVTFYNPTISN